MAGSHIVRICVFWSICRHDQLKHPDPGVPPAGPPSPARLSKPSSLDASRATPPGAAPSSFRRPPQAHRLLRCTAACTAGHPVRHPGGGRRQPQEGRQHPPGPASLCLGCAFGASGFFVLAFTRSTAGAVVPSDLRLFPLAPPPWLRTSQGEQGSPGPAKRVACPSPWLVQSALPSSPQAAAACAACRRTAPGFCAQQPMLPTAPLPAACSEGSKGGDRLPRHRHLCAAPGRSQGGGRGWANSTQSVAQARSKAGQLAALGAPRSRCCGCSPFPSYAPSHCGPAHPRTSPTLGWAGHP